MTARSARRLLEALYRAALEGAEPEASTRRALADPAVRAAVRSARRIGVFAAGKAAAGMARGALGEIGARPTLVVLPAGHPAGNLPRGAVHFSAHPEPDRRSVAAARRALRFFRSFGRADLVLCLVSGGASSLLALPRPGITLAQKRRAIRTLARTGAPIAALNRFRTSLSAVKGGGLGRATQARIVTLVLSDVPGDRAALVGSGPTVRGRRGDIARVVGSNRAGLDAAAVEARRRGLAVTRVDRRICGEARAAGRRLARRASGLRAGSVLLAGGETTVGLRGEAGRGGRCLELALGAALELSGKRDFLVLAAGSDGRDGSSGAAGAFAGAGTIARARRRGLAAGMALSRHDTRRFFSALGELFATGPTGTNVGDWVFLLRP